MLRDDHGGANVKFTRADDAVKFAEEVFRDLCAAHETAIGVTEVDPRGIEHATHAFKTGNDELLTSRQQVGIGNVVGGYQVVD